LILLILGGKIKLGSEVEGVDHGLDHVNALGLELVNALGLELVNALGLKLVIDLGLVDHRGLVGGSVGAVDGAVPGVLTINIDVGGEVEEVLESDSAPTSCDAIWREALVVVSGASDAVAVR